MISLLPVAKYSTFCKDSLGKNISEKNTTGLSGFVRLPRTCDDVHVHGLTAL